MSFLAGAADVFFSTRTHRTSFQVPSSDLPGAGESQADYDFNMKEFNEIRDRVFNKQDISSAKDWGDKLTDLQRRCFEQRSVPHCRIVSTEMTGASQLFQNLAYVTKATAEQARRVIYAHTKEASGQAHAGGAVPGDTKLNSITEDQLILANRFFFEEEERAEKQKEESGGEDEKNTFL